MNKTGTRTEVGGGLSDAQVAESRKRHGANILSVRPQKSFLAHFFSYDHAASASGNGLLRVSDGLLC